MAMDEAIIFCDCGYHGEPKFADENGSGDSLDRAYNPETKNGFTIARLDKTYKPGEKYCPRCGRTFQSMPMGE